MGNDALKGHHERIGLPPLAPTSRIAVVHELLIESLTSETNNDWTTALALLQQAHRQDPCRDSLLPAMARLLVRLGRHQEARALLVDQLTCNPQSIPAGLGLAEWHWCQGDRSAARLAYAAVLERCPDHLGARIAASSLSKPDSPRRLLFVLGMHRSGTSALAGALCRLGCRGPATMPPADLNNPTGYWEPLGIVALHTALLEQAQSSWDDPLISEDLFSPERLGEAMALLEAALRDEFPDRGTDGQWCLIKDPRQCRLQPLWNQFIERHHIPCAAVLVNRHPLAVVASLRRRDHLPTNRALLLWIQHQLDAERHTRSLPRQVITYETFLENPARCLSDLRDLLGEGQLRLPDPEQDPDLARPELNHSAGGISDLGPDTDESLMRLALEIHQTLRSTPEPVLREQLDRLNDELDRHLRSLRSQLGRMTTLQLFWQPQDAPGFSEPCSLRSSITVDRGSSSHTFRIPDLAGPICALRLDPAETPCLVRILRLVLHDGSGQLLWQWTPAEAGADHPQTLPFQPANDETRLLTNGEKEMAGISVLCDAHDSALLLNLNAATLQRVDSGSRLTIEASWDLLTSEVSHLLASLPATP